MAEIPSQTSNSCIREDAVEVRCSNIKLLQHVVAEGNFYESSVGQCDSILVVNELHNDTKNDFGKKFYYWIGKIFRFVKISRV